MQECEALKSVEALAPRNARSLWSEAADSSCESLGDKVADGWGADDGPDATFPLMGIPIGAIGMRQAISRVLGLAGSNGTTGSIVTFANVHMTVEAQRDDALRQVLLSAALNCPDSKPISWIGRYLFPHHVTRVAGPDFMPLFCDVSRLSGLGHFFYGGAPGVAEAAARKLEELYPGVAIKGVYSPPYRALSADEDDDICRLINESGADVLWVGLGCPKQEKWMFEHRDRLAVRVQCGVGQAFDILGLKTKRAPRILQDFGLEWAYRLASEPRRLLKRYLYTNTCFLLWLVVHWPNFLKEKRLLQKQMLEAQGAK